MAIAFQDLQAGQVYLVGLKFPDFLNDPSPVKSVPKNIEAWYTKSAVGQTRNVRNIRRHIALVIRGMEESNLAVILLGTRRPQHPHRYLPWNGSPQLDCQPPYAIKPNPPSAFFSHHGYLNFTHAIQVRVLHPLATQDEFTPGLCHMENFIDQGQQLQIFVEANELQNIRAYHLQYWAGRRYNADESEAINGRDETDPDDSDLSKRLASNVVSTRTNASVVALRSKENVTRVVSGSNDNNIVHCRKLGDDPIHPITGDCFSTMIGRALLNEDIRATQVELMDLEYELGDADCDGLIDGDFYSLSMHALTLFSSGYLEVDS